MKIDWLYVLNLSFIPCCLVAFMFLVSCGMDENQEEIMSYQSQMDISSISNRRDLPKRFKVISQELRIEIPYVPNSYCIALEDKQTKKQFLLVIRSEGGACIVPLIEE